MIEALFGTYYGLDWLAMTLGFFGSWTVGNKNPKGFIIIIFSVILAMSTAIIAGQYGFIAANAGSIVIATRNYRLWIKEGEHHGALEI